jgi:hypothetical protein
MENQETELEPETPTPSDLNPGAEPQDIDPAQWLEASTGLVTDYVVTRKGRLKIAALTETESDVIRKASESINPSNPHGPKKLNIKKMRLGTVAASINKAHGYTPADPRFMTPEKLQGALTGEITMIVNKITEIGGFKEDRADGLDQLFLLS